MGAWYTTHMKERGFEIIPEDGVVKMRVHGKTLEDLFRNAVRGVASYLKEGILDERASGEKEKRDIRIEAVDINSLLVDCLSHIVADSDMYNVVFLDIQFRTFGENFLEGELFGIPSHVFDNEIKAVSYTEVDVKRNPAGFFETTIVFET